MAAVLQAWCMGIPILIVVWETPQAKFFVETGIIFVTSLAFLLLIYVPKVMASFADRKNAIAEEKKKAYSSFIENRVKRENDFDDDGGKDDGDSDDNSAASANEGETTEDTSNDKGESGAESKKVGSPDSNGLHGNVAKIEPEAAKRRSSARLLMFGGAKKLDEQADGASGLKIIHNPRVSPEIMFTLACRTVCNVVLAEHSLNSYVIYLFSSRNVI